MAEGGFVHLHTHSQYSLLDCTSTPEKLVQAAVAAGMKALAVTDHGNLFGAVEFFEKARAAGIKPIIGYEAYVAPESRKSRQTKGIADAGFHLVLLAKNEAGYRNLVKLASAAYIEGFYYKPRIDKEILAEHSEGLVGLSACLGGEIPHLLLVDEPERAREVAGFYGELFGRDHFYIEIQNHGLEEQRRILPGLVGLAREVELPLVATNDVHYTNQEDWEAHDALLCINTGKLVSDENRMRFRGREFYFKSQEEMCALFGDYPDAIENTTRIAEMCEFEMKFGEMHCPHFEPPGGISAEEYLREECLEGFRKHFKEDDKVAVDRLERELDVICRVGYATYFLVVSDFIKFAKQEDIPVGPGRGSGAGSLVSYCLGITKIDPIKYELLFERFLEENRREKADFDIDFCMEKRDRVIEYVKEKYGEDKVAQIITFGTMAAKGVIRDVGRVLGVSLATVNELCKLIPSTPGTTLEAAFAAEGELGRRCRSDEQIARLFKIGRRLEGLARHPSVHAAGVVIADKPLDEYVPLYSSGGERITQFPMDVLPKVGLLKIDFLGLRTLTIIRRAVDLVKEVDGVAIDIDGVRLDDAKTFEMLSRGDSTGVFQFESSGFRDLLRRLKPDKFSDLIACVALYRPGPLGGGMVDDFVERKRGKAEIRYLHPLLEPILHDTYGVMAYQEQVMQILNRLGGMSMSDALTCIKAISKKNTATIEAYREEFLEGAVASGIDNRVAQELFDLITFFGGYGFNRSHSTAYALLSYQTAYLKANWPLEFFASTFTFEMGDTDKLSRFVKDAEQNEIDVLPPDVNESFADFRPVKAADGKGAIRYALAALKGVGTKSAEAIVAGREKAGAFKSIFHLAENVDATHVNRTALEIMVKAGGMDCFGARRSQMLAVVPDALEAGARVQADLAAGQGTFFGGLGEVEEEATQAALPDVPEWSREELGRNEKQAFGFYLYSHPASHNKAVKRYAVALDKIARVPDGREVVVGGTISDASVKTLQSGRNKGSRMATFKIDDGSGETLAAVIFSDAYSEFAGLVTDDRLVLLKGRIDHKREEPQVVVSKIIPVDEADAKLAAGVEVSLSSAGTGEDVLNGVAGILKRHPGRLPVRFRVNTPGLKVILEAGSEYRVAALGELVRECDELLGEGHVHFAGGNGGSSGGA